ncbi:GntR family transcriptional regulator [Alkalicoccus urumqiensis]|uniref:GntR family transcriptional regulator n=1 Tax=Alkalicoccus urumqiensis TaxID=1548213 RepID=A0A2P6MEG9_ALKUR|nr:GntR family transcriptional regulator [Alkalicoccus urumqiensis]PRO64668.1 GntR family transcriptional regulator [Alkalicoccus urumqiensis]
MLFHIDTHSSSPIYEQITSQVKEMCYTGLLRPGEQLPSIRELSSQMVVNPNTVSRAYAELERSGLIVTIRGRGTFVAEVLPERSTPRERARLERMLRRQIIDSYYGGLTREQIRDVTEHCLNELEAPHDGN